MLDDLKPHSNKHPFKGKPQSTVVVHLSCVRMLLVHKDASCDAPSARGVKILSGSEFKKTKNLMIFGAHIGGEAGGFHFSSPLGMG